MNVRSGRNLSDFQKRKGEVKKSKKKNTDKHDSLVMRISKKSLSDASEASDDEDYGKPVR